MIFLTALIPNSLFLGFSGVELRKAKMINILLVEE